LKYNNISLKSYGSFPVPLNVISLGINRRGMKSLECAGTILRFASILAIDKNSFSHKRTVTALLDAEVIQCRMR
jgi:hypothetical protein